MAHYKSPIHYRPKEGVLADTIPFYWEGEYHIFYLRGSIGKVPWEHIVSSDLVHWKELPTALVSDGDPNGPDGEHMFTGSVIEKDGTFHIFYTGWNPRNDKGREFVMHATSPDLITWTKHPEDIIGPDGILYANHKDRDWRDPYVFWNEEEKQYWMVVIANGVKQSHAVQGLLVSDDLKTWKHEPPLEGADGQECPDLFKIDDTYYLIGGDHYSYAKNIRGPYRQPKHSVIDRPGVYAAKRMFDGKRHIWTGWVWDTNNLKDEGQGIWGGYQCLPREIYAGPDGQLFCRPAPEVTNVFNKKILDLGLKPHLDTSAGTVQWGYDAGNIVGKSGSQCRIDVPDNYMLQLEVLMNSQTEFSIMMREQEDTREGYCLILRPNKQELVLSGTRNGVIIDTTKPVKIMAFVQGTVIECFVNDAYAFTRRAYNLSGGKLGLNISEGKAQILELSVKTDLKA
jgi:beta-fructofuranosidase